VLYVAIEPMVDWFAHKSRKATEEASL